jgi:hypothetical protein
MKKFLPAFFSAVGIVALATAQTTTVTKPDVVAYKNGYIIKGISANGKYAIYENRTEDEKSGGRIMNIDTKEETLIVANNYDDLGNGACADITDDGNIVVGVYDDSPAYWNKATGIWNKLPVSIEAVSGSVAGVTADGKYAVGREFYGEYPLGAVMWDLTTNSMVSLNNVPTADLSGVASDQNQFENISSDGQYILGVVSYSYINDIAYYVYDRINESYQYIGFDHKVGLIPNPNKSSSHPEYPDSVTGNIYTPQVTGLLHLDAAAMSPNGYWVTGRAYMSDDNVYTFVYNCKTKEFTVYNTDIDSGIIGIAIDDNGNAYGGTPADDPQREMYIRSGKYWYSMENVLSQRYDINFADKTGLDYTGTPVAVSGDGRFIAAFSNPEEGNGCNYTFYESVQDACSAVDLLGSYSVSPVSGSSFSAISSITVTFDRNVKLLGAKTAAQLLKSDGSLVRNSMGISVSGSKVTITFRPTTLTAGENYTVFIPAGTFAMESDTDVKTRDISVSYVGRSNTPVTAGTIYPTPGSAVSKIDYSSVNVLAYFDTYINIVDGATAKIYRNDETDAYETLSLYTSGNVLAIYPTSTLYFFKGNTYKIVLPAGSVTDAGGSGKNEELVINYIGGYEREVSSTDKSLFAEDFTEGLGSQFMFYEGDNNTPTTEMQGYGFTATSTPWWVASDETTVDPSGNYAAMSTSAYSPAGKSDDWMVTPSLYLPDETCYLTFKTQGFRKAKQDTLTVYIIPTTKVYNTLTTEAMTELRSKKEILFKEVVDPGTSEGNLINDWVTKEISLSAYAGKDVYIAFVNENEDQSIVFVDDVEVVHDMNYLIALDNETTVVNKDKVDIFGRVVVQTETSNYTTAHLELINAEGTVIDTIDESNLTIDKDHSYSFRFSKPLPVEAGKEDDFKLLVKLDNDSYTVSRTITNLAFSPTKRVFLEEYAGAECKNCPIGILAMEHLEELLPDNFIGVTVRTYDNDELSSNLDAYRTYLGLTAAPSAVINRKVIASPMTQLNGKYVFSNPDSPLWTDYVYDELNTPALADISISATLTDGVYVTVPVSVTYALNKNDVNVSLLLVVVEDKIKTYQLNTFYTISDENLGEWGAGGIYAKSTVRNYYINDIARSVVGTTYNGTQGYVPTSVTAGVENTSTVKFNLSQSVGDTNNARVVAVMIDNNTDEVINAAQCKLSIGDTSAIETVAGNSDNVGISLDADGNVVVNSDNAASVAVYSISGALVAAANGEGTIVAPTSGFNGVAIVRVATAGNVSVKKVIIK